MFRRCVDAVLRPLRLGARKSAEPPPPFHEGGEGKTGLSRHILLPRLLTGEGAQGRTQNAKRKATLALAALLVLGACAKAGGAGPTAASLPSAGLDHYIGDGIGDPTTCVLIARRSDHKVLYRYGQAFNCERGLPACDRPGAMSAGEALALADTADGRGASCASTPDGSRRVGWAEARVAGRDLIYSAVMEGQRALPGQEMMARLDEAFTNAGLEKPQS